MNTCTLITPIVLVFDGRPIIHIKLNALTSKVQSGLIDPEKKNDNKFGIKYRI